MRQQTIIIPLVLLIVAYCCQPGVAQTWPNPGAPGNRLPAVPIAPQQPTQASRPQSWPGGPAESSPWVDPSQRMQQPPVKTPPGGKLIPCSGSAIIARVGSEAILLSDVIGAVNEIIEKNKDSIPPDQLDVQRTMLIQQRLKSYIEAKLIQQDAKRAIPPEGWQHVMEQLQKEFEEHQVDKMLKSSGVKSPHELDLKLRALGSSLEQEKRSFCERTLAQQWVHQKIKRDDEVTCDQVIGYYYQHLKEFTHPARAKWEELMVSFSDHPDKAAARDALALMGNQVLHGVPFAQVAKRGSAGPTAADGGGRNWINKGSLVSKELDRALFTLPIGQLSPIIEGPTGWHIVRVIEREEASVTPYEEAQVEIREKLVRERMEKEFREYMAKLEAQTPVWTIFDNPDGPQMLSSRLGEYR